MAAGKERPFITALLYHCLCRPALAPIACSAPGEDAEEPGRAAGAARGMMNANGRDRGDEADNGCVVLLR